MLDFLANVLEFWANVLDFLDYVLDFFANVLECLAYLLEFWANVLEIFAYVLDVHRDRNASSFRASQHQDTQAEDIAFWGHVKDLSRHGDLSSR